MNNSFNYNVKHEMGAKVLVCVHDATRKYESLYLSRDTDTCIGEDIVRAVLEDTYKREHNAEPPALLPTTGFVLVTGHDDSMKKCRLRLHPEVNLAHQLAAMDDGLTTTRTPKDYVMMQVMAHKDAKQFRWLKLNDEPKFVDAPQEQAQETNVDNNNHMDADEKEDSDDDADHPPYDEAGMLRAHKEQESQSKDDALFCLTGAVFKKQVLPHMGLLLGLKAYPNPTDFMESDDGNVLMYADALPIGEYDEAAWCLLPCSTDMYYKTLFGLGETACVQYTPYVEWITPRYGKFRGTMVLLKDPSDALMDELVALGTEHRELHAKRYQKPPQAKTAQVNAALKAYTTVLLRALMRQNPNIANILKRKPEKHAAWLEYVPASEWPVAGKAPRSSISKRDQTPQKAPARPTYPTKKPRSELMGADALMALDAIEDDSSSGDDECEPMEIEDESRPVIEEEDSSSSESDDDIVPVAGKSCWKAPMCSGKAPVEAPMPGKSSWKAPVSQALRSGIDAMEVIQDSSAGKSLVRITNHLGEETIKMSTSLDERERSFLKRQREEETPEHIECDEQNKRLKEEVEQVEHENRPMSPLPPLFDGQVA